MNNRELKFRVWDGIDYMSTLFTLKDLQEKKVMYASNTVVMQYTGLKDKNGKEIYEGDWCRAEFRTKDGIQVIQGHIIMDEFMWCIDCTGCVGDDIFSINRPHNFEVIGNIYENPELLNK